MRGQAEGWRPHDDDVPGDLMELYGLVTSNRARIEGVERELDRVRDSLHSVRSEVQAVRYLAERVGELAGDVRKLAEEVQRVARHTVARPSVGAVGVLGQYLALVVAALALILAVHH